MIPYREASQEVQKQTERPLKFAAAAASLALPGVGAGIASRVIPFLSQYIPEELAIKGLSKVDPRFGQFISKSLSEGKSFQEVKDFIKEKIQGSEESQENPKESRGIIEQYSPELKQFIMQEIQKGRSPIQAGAVAQAQGKFNDIISKMSKDHKIPFSSILETDFGVEGQEPANQQQKGGQGQQALMAILQKIQQSRGQQ